MLDLRPRLGRRRETVTTGANLGTAGAIVCAAATFAPNSYARLRLIRQLHASGLLSGAANGSTVGQIDTVVPARRVPADDSAAASC